MFRMLTEDAVQEEASRWMLRTVVIAEHAAAEGVLNKVCGSSCMTWSWLTPIFLCAAEHPAQYISLQSTHTIVASRLGHTKQGCFPSSFSRSLTSSCTTGSVPSVFASVTVVWPLLGLGKGLSHTRHEALWSLWWRRRHFRHARCPQGSMVGPKQILLH